MNAGVPGYDDGMWYFWEGRFENGIEFRSFYNPGTVPGIDHPDYTTPDSFEDLNARIYKASITLQVWLPGPNAILEDGSSGGRAASMSAQLSGAFEHPMIVVHTVRSPDELFECGCPPSEGPTDKHAIQIGRYLASRGIVFARWVQGDYIEPLTANDPFVFDPSQPETLALPEAPLWSKFGFPNESSLSSKTRDYIKSYGDNSRVDLPADLELSLSDCRLDFRWALAQGSIVSAQFVKSLVRYYAVNAFGASAAQADDWASRSRLVYSGGSKGGLATLSAAGADFARTLGIRAAGTPAWSLGMSVVETMPPYNETFTELSSINRYETDWLEGTESLGGRKASEERVIGKWMSDSVFHSELLLQPPYYADIYVPSRDVDRYLPFFVVDVIGTHDAISPLGGPEDWWRQHDNLFEPTPITDDWSVRDPNDPVNPQSPESRFGVRRIRNINKDHGGEYFSEESEVRALAIFGGKVYSAGTFGIDGGPPEHRVLARESDGVGGWYWAPVGSSFDGPVNSLAVAGSSPAQLYAGGGFTSVAEGAVPALYIARLSGSEWEKLPGTAQPNGTVRALLGTSTSVFAGGDFTQIGGDGAFRHVGEFLLGSNAWSPLELGLTGPVYALAGGTGSNLYVGGSFFGDATIPISYLGNVARWNGIFWVALGSGSTIGVNGPVRALSYIGTTLLVGGEFTTAGTTSASKIAKRAGNSWSSLDKGLSGAVRSICADPGDAAKAYVGGTFGAARTNNGGPQDLKKTCRVARVNFSGAGVWEAMEQGVDDAVLALIGDSTTPAPADVVLAGRFTEIGRYSGSPAVSSNLSARHVASFDPNNPTEKWTALDRVPLAHGAASYGTIDAPVSAENQLTRRSFEHALKKRNGIASDLPRVDRAAFHPSGSSGWTMQVYTEEIPPGADVRFRIHVAFSDDRDFRRFDGPGSSPGRAERNPLTLSAVYPSKVSDERYYEPDAGKVLLGGNTVAEVGFTFERTSAYFDTKPWEDVFYTVTPTSVAGPDAKGFYKLTFDPPSGYPWGGTNLLAACIVEMRVGRPDDGLWDDVVMTEVAFANDDLYGHYDAESPDPLICNCDAALSLVWPDRGRSFDFVYLVGDKFFVQHDGLSSGIEWIRFYRAGTTVFEQITPSNADIDLIGSRAIRCRLPGLQSGFAYDVAIRFLGGSCTSSPTEGCAIKYLAVKIDP